MALKHNFKKLEVWKRARLLVKSIYLISAAFPVEERFGITAQIRSAVISIPLNIAEGSGRSTNKDFSRFLDNAYGSALEVETTLYLSYDLNFINEKIQEELVSQVIEVQKMIRGFQ